MMILSFPGGLLVQEAGLRGIIRLLVGLVLVSLVAPLALPWPIAFGLVVTGALTAISVLLLVQQEVEASGTAASRRSKWLAGVLDTSQSHEVAEAMRNRRRQCTDGGAE